MRELLDFIYKEQRELSHFGGIAALLGWDQMTYMPQAGSKDRANQIALISRLSHEKFTEEKLYNNVKKLNEVATLESLAEHDHAVVVRLKRDIEKARKVPSAFVEKMAKTTTLSYAAWEEARHKKQFSVFAPHLEEIVALEKEYCTYIDLHGPAYNSLLDGYEEGMTVDKLQREFAFLKSQLKTMLEKITSSETYTQQKPLGASLNQALQQQLCSQVIELMKLPKQRSRLDSSTHPFTTAMGYDDVRITTNFERPNPLFSFFATVHEAGHALYELHLPQDVYKDTVISDSPSLGLHESQSRFWENMIARSKPFWDYFYPFFQKTAGSKLKEYDLQKWYHAINQVKPSLIRVEADELTYGLHVILRFELELALIDGNLNVSELPHVWNEKMQELLGITPSNDVEGVLQDMHWSGGSFGYFPTYAIGSIYAAQLYMTLKKHQPDLESTIQQGIFDGIIDWLSKNVHHIGRRLTADEIINTVCGNGLNAHVFVEYLQSKYYPLYGI